MIHTLSAALGAAANAAHAIHGALLQHPAAAALLPWVTATQTPSPSPTAEFNKDLVTPTYVGFFATAFVAVATILLVVDMNRRVRRTRYRELAREQLEAEARQADSAEHPG